MLLVIVEDPGHIFTWAWAFRNVSVYQGLGWEDWTVFVCYDEEV